MKFEQTANKLFVVSGCFLILTYGILRALSPVILKNLCVLFLRMLRGILSNTSPLNIRKELVHSQFLETHPQNQNSKKGGYLGE